LERFCENIIPEIAGKFNSNAQRMVAKKELIKNMECSFDKYTTDELIQKLEKL
jgi:hypothetical protein